ncbi:MAG: hypothetical protein AAF958_09575 [Planctomycetota bacterium]
MSRPHRSGNPSFLAQRFGDVYSDARSGFGISLPTARVVRIRDPLNESADWPSVVQRLSTLVLGSCRRDDQILIRLEGRFDSGLTLTMPPDLRVQNVSFGSELDESPNWEPGQLVLPGRDDCESILVRCTRAVRPTPWFRRCRVPFVRCDADVLSRQASITPVAGTFLPAGLIRATPNRTLPIRPGRAILLVPTAASLSIAWLVALACLGIGLALSRRNRYYSFLVVVGVLLLVTLWRDWHTGLAAFVALPLVLGITLALVWLPPRASYRSPGTRRRQFGFRSRNLSATRDVSTSSDFSVGVILPFLFWIGIGNDVAAQDRVIPSDGRSREVRPVLDAPLLLSVDERGRPLGDVVYVPESLERQIKSGDDDAGVLLERAPVQFLEARYELDLRDAFADQVGRDSEGGIVAPDDGDRTQTPRDTATIVCTYRWRDDTQNVASVRLPIRPSLVVSVEAARSGNRLRHSASVDGTETIIDLGGQAIDRVRVTTRASLVRRDDRGLIRLPVFPLAKATLELSGVMSNEPVLVRTATGFCPISVSANLAEVNLGPVDQVRVQFRGRPLGGAPNRGPLGRRYLAFLAPDAAFIRCEVQPAETFFSGDRYQFVIRSADLPMLTGNGWRWQASELFRSSRRLVTVIAIRDNPGPIELFWKRDLSGNASDDSVVASDDSVVASDDSVVASDDIGDASDDSGDTSDDVESGAIVDIPEVIAAALGENAPALVAYHGGPRYRIQPIADGPLESTSQDQFRVSWRGSDGPIDRVLVCQDRWPELQVRRIGRGNPGLEADVHYQVSRNLVHATWKIRRRASPADDAGVGMPNAIATTLEIPNDWKVESFRGAGPTNAPTASAWSLDRGPKQTRLIADDRDGPWTLRMSHRLVTTNTRGQLRGRKVVRLPAIFSSGVPVTVNGLTMERDDHVGVQWLDPKDAAETSGRPAAAGAFPNAVVTPSDLRRGWLPVTRWRANEIDEERIPTDSDSSVAFPAGAEFRVQNLPPVPIEQSTTILESIQNRWEAELRLELRAGGSLAERCVDILVPDPLRDEIRCDIDAVKCVLPSLEPGKSVARFYFPKAESPPIFRAAVELDENGRIGAPDWQCLSNRKIKRQILVPRLADAASDVPDRSGRGLWDAVGVRPLGVRGDKLAFQVQQRSAYVRRMSVDQPESSALVHSSHVRMLQTEIGAVLDQELLLDPGSQMSLRIKLPVASELLGVWVEGRYWPPRERDDGLLEIPLRLSNLPQRIRLSYRFDTNANSTSTVNASGGAVLANGNPVGAAALATWTDASGEALPMIRQWYTRSVAINALVDPGTEPSPTDIEARDVVLATALVDAVESAVAALALRTGDQSSAWLSLRMAEFRRLMDRAMKAKNLPDRRWDTLLKRMNDIFDSLDATDHSQASGFDFSVDHLDRKALGEDVFVDQITSTKPSILAFSGRVARDPTDESLQRLILNLITLAIVIAVIVALRDRVSKIDQWCDQPSLWLFLIGLTLTLVIPRWVGLTIMLVAALFALTEHSESLKLMGRRPGSSRRLVGGSPSQRRSFLPRLRE